MKTLTPPRPWALFGARAWPLTAALALSVGALGCPATPAGGARPDQVAASSNLSAFVATDIEGRAVDMGEHLGRDVVLISFWGTYCEPCKTEMPFLQRLHERYAAEGLFLLSVSLDGPDTSSGVRPYIRSNGYTFPVVIDEDTSIAQAYNPRTVAPYTILIGRDGRVAKTIEGFQLSEAPAVEAAVKALLGAGRGSAP